MSVSEDFLAVPIRFQHFRRGDPRTLPPAAPRPFLADHLAGKSLLEPLFQVFSRYAFMRKSAAEEYYDRHARSYSPRRGFSPDDIGNSLYFADQIMWHFLKKYAPRRKSSLILHAGAGTGDWTLLFAKLGYRNLVLADISQGMLEEARRKFASVENMNVSFVKSDISNLKEFRTGRFDFVFSQYDAVSLCLKPRAAVKALAGWQRREHT